MVFAFEAGDKSIAGQYELQNDLVAMRHTGRDVRLETTRRWMEFCSTPQDQDAVAASSAELKQSRQLAKMKAFVESGGDLGLEESANATEAVRRGRPKGSKNKPKVAVE